MEKRSEYHFRYPPNIHELDLATMVSMYRARGEPRKAAPGEYLSCCVTHHLIKEGKWWFGLYYSQKAWDTLLTRGSGGYPLTDVELSLLGMVRLAGDEPIHRDFAEKNCGTIPKLAYLIVNDLKQFGFLIESENGFLSMSSNGDQALQGVCRRIYGKRFTPEMLSGLPIAGEAWIREGKTGGSEQTTLF